MKCCCADLIFLQQLLECYFHPSRDGEFLSPDIKYFALAAMLRLWEKDAILLLGKAYGRSEIHHAVILRMRPEHLDAAVNFFLHSTEVTTVDQLAEVIFANVIHSGTMAEIQFERDCGGAA